MKDQLLTPKEAAAYCRVSLSWLANKRWRGGGPDFVKNGQIVLYRLSALDSWLEAHTVARHSNSAAISAPDPRRNASNAMDV